MELELPERLGDQPGQKAKYWLVFLFQADNARSAPFFVCVCVECVGIGMPLVNNVSDFRSIFFAPPSG